MTVDEETLIAFADNELNAPERDAVERALADNASLRAKLAMHQRLRARLASAFDGALNEPVPAPLLAAAHGAPRNTEVVSLHERRARRWSAPEWGAMAASLAAGFVLAFGLFSGDRPPFESRGGALVASGALARALETQLAADTNSDVRIGLTFRSREGQYCRTFALAASNTTGLACNDDGAWSVAMTAAAAPTGEIRTAGADMPLAVLAAVDAIIDGETLDANSEAAARDQGWRDGKDAR